MAGLPQPEVRRPQSVLFACAYNAIRSPMAEAIGRYYFGQSIFFASAGVRVGTADPFVAAVLEETGIAAGKHRPRSFEEIEEFEGLNFDLIITLSPEAHHKALDLTRTIAAAVEYWPMPDPSLCTGNRTQQLDAYRALRDTLTKRITTRLG